MSLRLRPELREMVKAVADRQGSSINETMNMLVERGLNAERRYQDTFGSENGFNVARAIIAAAEAATCSEGGDNGLWLNPGVDGQPALFHKAATAMKKVIDLFAPAAPEVEAARAGITRSRRAMVGE